jgi:hypothetical protein
MSVRLLTCLVMIAGSLAAQPQRTNNSLNKWEIQWESSYKKENSPSNALDRTCISFDA